MGALIRQAESGAPYLHSRGSFARVVNAGRMIGIDRTTGQPKSERFKGLGAFWILEIQSLCLSPIIRPDDQQEKPANHLAMCFPLLLIKFEEQRPSAPGGASGIRIEYHDRPGVVAIDRKRDPAFRRTAGLHHTG